MRFTACALATVITAAVAVPGLARPPVKSSPVGYSPSAAAPKGPHNALHQGRPTAIESITPPPFCAGPLQVQGVYAYVCEFPVNWMFDAADLASFATAQFGVTIQAVGGNGGDGGSSLGGTVGAGAGGQPGLAQATLRGDTLAGKSLYIYVGNNGGFGAPGKGGNGGAATVVSTAPLTPQPGSLDGILVAAGGGGGGQGYGGAQPTCLEVPLPASISDEVFVSCAGGDGGLAIGIDAQNRVGFAGLGATPPVINQNEADDSQYVANLGAGQPARFDAGAWVPGSGGGTGSAGLAAFSFAGAPGAGSTATWVRDTAALKLGSATVLGGQGSEAGGGGGGGVAGGGGSSSAGGAGGASFAVGSGYGLTEGEALTVPCDAESFCARNWFSPAGTDQPTVVITFWVIGDADPLIPADGETIDTDQPSLVFEGTDASSGIHYLLEDPLGQIVNYSGLINGSATGNLLWTVPPGLLAEGQTYDWYVTDQVGKTLQDPQSFTVATGTTPSGLSEGWTLYVRSMDKLDTSLPVDLQPLDNQPVPTVFTSCQCTCETNVGAATPVPELPLSDSQPLGSTYPSCGGYISKAYCDCTWNANGNAPTASGFWIWNADTGSGCTASSGSCYANAQMQSGTIDIDWASASNPLGLLVPSRLINITSEPSSPSDGDAVPSLAVPTMDGFNGSCADSSQVEVTFTARTNGGIRFQIYADPSSGEPTGSPMMAIDDWDINNCSWSGTSSQPSGTTGGNQAYSNEYMEAEVYKTCQSSVAEQTGSQTFCLTPGTPYRVRFDGVQPYLPGPMELGFKLAGMDSSAPIPANWISTCTLDGSTGTCSETLSGYDAFTVLRTRGRFENPEETRAYVRERFKLREDAREYVRERIPERIRERIRERFVCREDIRPYVRGRIPERNRDCFQPTLLTGEEGTAGADSCTAAGSTVSCTWTANGTWELPSLYTLPGGWITVQAIGGAGGAGDPATSNPGGAAGRAQAVLPADSLAGKTLHAYVGESGADIYSDGIDPIANGGAASLVTTSPIPSSFVSSGCNATPEDIDALVIAAGGGGGSIALGNTTSASGGSGGIAVGGSGIQQTYGSGTPGGQGGGAWGGQSPVYGSNPYDGTDTVSGGASATPDDGAVGPGSGALALGGGGVLAGEPDFATQTASWVKNTSYLTLGKPSSTAVCGGGTSDWVGGAGGGGHAAGGSGAPAYAYTGNPGYPAGGGGGSSWATGAGAGVAVPAALAGWQTLETSDPGQVVITVDCPDCVFASECAMADSSLRPVMRCTFTQSVQPLDASSLGTAVGALIGQDIGDQVPVYVEAWGGFGGAGGPLTGNCDGADGGNNGTPGYARSSHTFGRFSEAFPSVWLYIGAKGPDGPWVDNCSSGIGAPGAGGAATLVLSAPLSETTTLEDLLVTAGGGGGGGQGNCGEFCYAGYTARRGGQAIATTAGSASPSGNGQSGGGDSIGGCDVGGQPCGKDGIGGLGGGLGSGAATGWVGLSSEWSQGQGGQTPGGGGGGGAGGGGYGGGGVGPWSGGHAYGGGAGGSSAAQATLNDTGAPVLGPDGSPSSTNGVVVISFDVCSTYPTLSVCQP